MNQWKIMEMIEISILDQDRICLSFSYNPNFVRKIKLIKGYKWHLEGKYWSFPNTNVTLEKILKVFDRDKIHIDPTLQRELSSVIMRCEEAKQFQIEDLKRKLISKKYRWVCLYPQIIEDKRIWFTYNQIARNLNTTKKNSKLPSWHSL